MKVIEESIDVLPEYGLVPISFEVRSVFDVTVLCAGLGGFTLLERQLDTPWIKDYDAMKGEGPARWAARWDLTNWGVISARAGGARVAGCVIAHDTDGVFMLEGRDDIAVLWDLRVHPDFRRTGIGSELLDASIAWARERACRILKIETQNINVPACRLYAGHGFTLGSVNRFAYPELSDEVELVWVREL